MDDFPSSKGPRRHHETFSKRRALMVTQDNFENTGRRLRNQRAQKCRLPSAIFRLPREIMVEIFHYTKLFSSNSTGSYENWKWCWLTVTHVCKDWRDIAIGTQGLWTYIDTAEHASTEQTGVYLKRSGTSGLVVFYTRNTSHKNKDDVSFSCLSLALRQFHRIRELHIEDPLFSPELDKLWSALTRNPAPMLQAFSLNIQNQKMYDIKALFAGQAPRLKKMTLHMNSPSYAVPIMRNLKQMLLSPTSKSFTLQETLSILLENPNFESFKIFSFTPYGVSLLTGPHTITSPILLSSLKDLMLECVSYEQLCSFFECVDMPALKPDPKSIIPRSYSRSKYTTLELSLCSRFVRIIADITKENGDRRYSRRTITYSWENEAQQYEELGESVLAVDCMSFVCTAIKGGFWCFARELTIEIEGCNDDAEDLSLSDNLGYLSWIELLKLLPELEQLTIRQASYILSADNVDEAQFGLLKALAGTHADGGGKFNLICPNLSVLCLCGMNLKIGLVNLVECLAYRASKWKRLHKLILSEPSEIEDSILQSLKDSGVFEKIEVGEDYFWMRR